MKNILLTVVMSILFLSFLSNAQDITNTLGPNGSFIVKDSLNEFLSVDQPTGNLRLFRNLVLPLSSTNAGVIFIDTTRFLHTYGTENLFLGVNAGNNTLTSFYGKNTAVGTNTLKSLTTGYWNSAFGYSALNSNTEGFNNTAFGYFAMYSNTTGDWNSAFGSKALYSNTTGENNSAFGVAALGNNSTGSDNSAYGYYALHSNTTGFDNSAFGSGALNSNGPGSWNSAFGTVALGGNSTGEQNSAFGSAALGYNSTGIQNSAFGSWALTFNTTGSYNSAFGRWALYSNTTGYWNSAFGEEALSSNLTGEHNSALGYKAGSTLTFGSNNTLIGFDAQPSSPTVNHQITLGNNMINSLRCNVQNISSLSDVRDKKNIEDLSLGLDFITKLKPRQFNWDRRDWYPDGVADGSKMQEEPTAGFIAQELDEVQISEDAEWLNLVLKDNPEKWEATYGNLLPVMVKAIQELSIKNEKLKIEKDEQIAQLSEQNNKLRSEVEELRTIKDQLAEIRNLKTELIEQIKLLKTDDKSETKFTSIIK